MYYALKEAAQRLRVTQNTVERWLQDAGISLYAPNVPMLSDDQLRDLAQRHGLALESRDTRGGSPGTVSRQIQALHARLERIEEALGLSQRHNAGAPRHDRDARSVALEQVVRRAIGFLADIAHMPGTDQEPIIITAFHGPDVYHLAPRLRTRWIEALRAVLDAGWDVLHLYGEKPGPSRARQLVGDLIKLLDASGKYDPAYVEHSQPVSPPWEYILTPHHGILMIALPESRGLPSSVVLRGGREYNAVYEQLRALATDSHKLLTRTPPDAVGFSRSLADAEDQDGNRCLVMDGLSEIHVPFTVFAQRLHELEQKTKSRTEWAEATRLSNLLTIRRRREDAFETQLRQFPVRDITTREALLRLARDGIFSPTDRLRKNGVLTPSQRAGVLEWLAKRLDDNPRTYQLAVLEDATVARLYPQMHRLFWMVKHEHTVLMEVLRDVGARRNVELDISIDDPNLVTAFYDYFQRALWRRIPQREKDRTSIATLLRELARPLRELE